MKILRATVMVVFLALAASAAHAAPAPRKARAAHRTGARPPSPPAPGAPASEGSRRLDDIHIEGEIAVPQVLFITARDQRRFLDFQHHRYLKTSVAVGEAATFPSRIAVTPGQSLDARKETAP